MNKIDFGQFLTASPDGYSVLGWIVLLPLLGAIINGVWGKKLGRQGVYIAGVASVAASFLLSVIAFAALYRAGHAGGGGEHHALLSYLPKVGERTWQWMVAPTSATTSEVLHVRYVLDPLSGVMLLVVTGVGTLIHVYSTGYMSHDGSYARFFSYLNLFVFAMLNLILGDSLVLMFLGWEGVGLCSYLLIGFWFQNPSYAAAGRKAFIVNRIGDAGFILGMTILAWKGGSYQFETLRAHVTVENSTFWAALSAQTNVGEFLSDVLPVVRSVPALATAVARVNFTWGGLACLLLFIGCTGKSAQIPLYVWLPDAMAGPTPVSALIHAATMVTAGIYLLCRLSFLYQHFTSVLNLIALTGAATALLAATIACTQTELKKVLAYSTVSQLGFMFMGCGVGAFGAGFFHVFTHAFFKACLFLGAGAVMHACHDNQDIRTLGGLKKYLPGTFWTFTAATVAIIGFPLTAGFFSKDEILFRALSNPFAPTVGRIVFATGIVAATLTSFYMCRLLFLTFFGEYRGATAGAAIDETTHPAGEALPHGAHEALDAGHVDPHDAHGTTAHADDHGGGHGRGGLPSEEGLDMKLMVYPLFVLAVLSLGAGLLGIPHGWTDREGIIFGWLEPAVFDAAARTTVNAQGVTEHSLGIDFSLEKYATILGTLAFLVGAGIAYWMYVLQRGEPARRIAAAVPPLHRLLVDKWRVDELYNVTVIRPVRWLAEAATTLDRYFIDGLVKLTGWIPLRIGYLGRQVQDGRIQGYGAVLAVGTLALLLWALYIPHVSIAQRPAEGGQVVLEASGGPGFTYRWAFFDPNPEARRASLDELCPESRARAAIERPAANTPPVTERRVTQRFEGPRCAALLAQNAFARTTLATAYVTPPPAGGPPVILAPGQGQ